jgi:hypothetical protein
MNPLGPGPGLAEPAPCHHQPRPPAFAARLKLLIVRPRLECRLDQQRILRPAFSEPGALLLDRIGRQPRHQAARYVNPHGRR